MKLSRLIYSFILCYAVAALGSLVTLPSLSSWYVTLHKPFFTPPNWLFGPVWAILYTLMAIAFALIWSLPEKKQAGLVREAKQLFAVQLFLNLLWSLAFFGWHSPWGGVIVIMLLWLAIVGMLITFYRLNKFAGYVLVPYLLWVSFAGGLNLFVAMIN